MVTSPPKDLAIIIVTITCYISQVYTAWELFNTKCPLASQGILKNQVGDMLSKETSYKDNILELDIMNVVSLSISRYPKWYMWSWWCQPPGSTCKVLVSGPSVHQVPIPAETYRVSGWPFCVQNEDLLAEYHMELWDPTDNHSTHTEAQASLSAPGDDSALTGRAPLHVYSSLCERWSATKCGYSFLSFNDVHGKVTIVISLLSTSNMPGCVLSTWNAPPHLILTRSPCAHAIDEENEDKMTCPSL